MYPSSNRPSTRPGSNSTSPLSAGQQRPRVGDGAPRAAQDEPLHVGGAILAHVLRPRTAPPPIPRDQPRFKEGQLVLQIPCTGAPPTPIAIAARAGQIEVCCCFGEAGAGPRPRHRGHPRRLSASPRPNRRDALLRCRSSRLQRWWWSGGGCRPSAGNLAGSLIRRRRQVLVFQKKPPDSVSTSSSDWCASSDRHHIFLGLSCRGATPPGDRKPGVQVT